MLQRKVRYFISVMIVGMLLLTSPFHYVYADEGGTFADDPTFINARNFWLAYGLDSATADNRITISCSSSATEYCSLYQGYLYPNNYYQLMTGSTFNRYSAYNSNNRLRLTPDPTYIVFISNTNITANNIVAYPQSGSVTATRITNDRLTVNSPNKMYLIVIKANNNASSGTVYTTLDFTNATASTSIIPLFLGTEAVMNDATHRLVFGTSQTYTVSDTTTHTLLNTINTSINTANNHLYGLVQNTNTITTQLTNIRSDLNKIINGTSTTTTTVNDMTTQNTQLTGAVTDFNNLEDTFNNNFTTDFNNIPFNNNMLSNSSLVQSMSWVRTQFDRMTANNVFGTFIQYALLFGLGLLIIGRL